MKLIYDYIQFRAPQLRAFTTFYIDSYSRSCRKWPLRKKNEITVFKGFKNLGENSLNSEKFYKFKQYRKKPKKIL